MVQSCFQRKTRISIVLIAILLFSSSCTSTYSGRLIIWNFNGYDGYKKYPIQQVQNSSTTHKFEKSEKSLLSSFKLHDGELPPHKNFEELLKDNETTSFIVIKNNTICYERYFHGTFRDSIRPAFSVSKSVLSLLIGIAIDEGEINGINDLISDYLPELKENELFPITIQQLLTMSSGIEHCQSYGFLPWGSDIRVGMSPDVQGLVLSLKSEEKPGRSFLYHNQVPILLAMILKRATGKTISQYTEEKLWKRLGMEYSAFWILDSREAKFEKTDGGFNARSIDYAKLGQLVLNQGQWHGKQIISKNWIKESTSPDFSKKHLLNLYNRKGLYYKYLWWGVVTNTAYAPIADGRYGQFLFVDHESDVVIVRNGTGMGKISHKQWYGLLMDIARQIKTVN
ncbi:serine hydrolase [Desulfococcaceae bacterium HSG9]|nr:serine hydrolase [Desulfococcaceae bacterium HSG9]